MRANDYLIFGFYVPGGPRAKNHQAFFDGTLTEVTVTRVVRPLYRSDAEIWTDKLYPERVDLEVLDAFTQIPGPQFGLPSMRALRMSGTKQGAPVAGGPPTAMGLATAIEDQSDDSVGFEGDLDALIMAFRRREQRQLRKIKFGARAIITCDLCGRDLPARLVTAAHIKRRAEAGRDERLNPYNIMAACLLGCDALFEHGHVYVDSTGVIRDNTTGQAGLREAVGRLAGRRCSAHHSGSRTFFEAHAERARKFAPVTQERADTAWPVVQTTVDTKLSRSKSTPTNPAAANAELPT
ncbi:hypothetical protein [Micromonospora sp. IBHARD004]|uniref:hypothetical protein n=1 Tax=Micromonospora sp. IBHARD004 TaxID=3457764 RepID=UPI0040586E15